LLQSQEFAMRRTDSAHPAPGDRAFSRRAFLRHSTLLAAGGALAIQAQDTSTSLKPADTAKPTDAKPAPPIAAFPAPLMKELFDSLDSAQKTVLCLPLNHPERFRVGANWAINDQKIDDLQPAQRELVTKLFHSLCSPEGKAMFEKQMADDDKGLGRYHIAFFGTPADADFEFLLTGRHATFRANANLTDGIPFGGPIVYGHSPHGFNEKADHPDNVFWYQGKRANELFTALTDDQKKAALLDKAPREEDIKLDPRESYRGQKLGALAPDAMALAEKLLADLLLPYAESARAEVRAALETNGGLGALHLSCFRLGHDGKPADIGKDQVWDIFRVEGPGFVWHFRGAPHVHGWLHVCRKGATPRTVVFKAESAT
jgi:hypothetical protein